MAKRNIPRAFFEPLEDIKASDLLDSDILLNLIKKETPLAIREAFQNNKIFATLFEVNALGMYMDIPKQYWIPALEACIHFKVESEDYEGCKDLTDLIQELRKPTTKITKKKTDGTTTKRNTNSN